MAMIDSNIYFQQKTADPMGSFAEGMKMGDMIKQRRDQENIKQAYKAGMVRNPDGTYKQDLGITMSELAKGGYAQEYSSLAQQQRDQEAAKLKQQTERTKGTSELLNNTLYNIENAKTPEAKQAAYTYGLELGRKMGLDVSSLSPTFTPEVHSYLKNAAGYSTDAKFKQEQQNNDRNYKVAQDRLALDRDKNAIEKQKNALSQANEYRKERSGLPTTKATQDVSAAYNKIRKASEIPSAAGDLSIIFSYNKMLDPGSTVREGEFANAQNAAGWTDQARNAYNKALNGQRLNPEQRADFIRQAENLYMGQLDLQNQVDSTFKDLAKKSGVDPSDVIVNYEASPNRGNQLGQNPKSPPNQNINYEKMSDDEITALYNKAKGKSAVTNMSYKSKGGG